MDASLRDFLRFSVATGSATARGMLVPRPLYWRGGRVAESNMTTTATLVLLGGFLSAETLWTRFTRIVFVALVLFLAACASPEATRTRGGGPGADVGNRKGSCGCTKARDPSRTPLSLLTPSIHLWTRPIRRMSSAAADAKSRAFLP